MTCTFFNTEVGGSIVIEKQTLPDGDPAFFTFTADYQDPFQLSDGQLNDSGTLEPDTYSAAETVPAGWFLVNIACEGGESVLIGTDGDFDFGDTSVTVALGAGQTSSARSRMRSRRHLIHRRLRHPSRLHPRRRLPRPRLHRRLHHRLHHRSPLGFRRPRWVHHPGDLEPGKVKYPGSDVFVTPREDEPLPPGTVVDVSDGKGIELSDRQGNEAVFYGAEDDVPSVFVVAMVNGVIELRLIGGDFGPTPRRSTTAASGKPVRRLWGKGKGKFRTKGRFASAAVRGTWWLTADYRELTFVRVPHRIGDGARFPEAEDSRRQGAEDLPRAQASAIIGP